VNKGTISKQSFLVVLMLLLALLGSATVAAQESNPDSIATVTVSKDAVSVQSRQDVGFEITLAGPGDFYLRQEYPAGGHLTLRVVDDAGNPLPDGLYNYEIHVLSQAAPVSYDEAQRGFDPDGAQAPVQSGSFSILDGSFVLPDVAEESAAGDIQAPVLPNDQLILDDLIVDGSICVGFDCINGESFGFDTLRLKENNLRIHFQDTSTSASFPTNDWRISVNDSANGGADYFAIQDADAGQNVFVIEASAGSNALYVDDYGQVGFGTSTPAVELEIRDSDTPSVRLNQDGSGGWSPQTWDMAGNEANFFIRDVTNGSQLPFRIQPGADSNALTIKSDNKVGIGTWNPDVPLEIYGNNIVALKMVNTGGGVAFQLDSNDDGNFWNVTALAGATGDFVINNNDGANTEFELTGDGDLTIEGDYFSATCTSPGSPCAPDYVFEDDYKLMSLEELEVFIKQNKHLPNVPSENDLREAGVINNSEFQMILLEKIEELTLYTLQQQQIIEELEARLEALEGAK
jgi:hypothetical protein